MGFSVTLSLIVEIMGKYANLILCDEGGKILTAMKLIDFSSSTVRQVLPGLTYVVPADQGKRSPLTVDRDFFYESFAAFPSGRSVEKFITSTFGGIATQVAHELCFRATGGVDTPLLATSADALYPVFLSWQELLLSESYTPVALIDNGKPVEYCYMPLTYLGDRVEMRTFDSFADLFDFYFAERDRLERIHQRAGDLLRLIHNATARTEKKLALQRAALLESERAEEYKRAGDLITANLYLLKRGMTSISVVDYYDDPVLQLRNALVTAEAALMTAMELTDRTLRDTTVAVLGYGRIGKYLSRLLSNLGAQVTVCARRQESLFEAASEGCRPLLITQAPDGGLAPLCRDHAVLFNTVPAPILPQEILLGLEPSTLLMDLASAPFGVGDEDVQEATAQNGLRYLRAPSLPGSYAPRDAGRIIAECILNRLAEAQKGGEGS
jgi:dipicolinic acid synthetase A subunit